MNLWPLGTLFSSRFDWSQQTSQKVRKKVFNWSEVQSQRSNFLQNPYFSARILKHFLKNEKTVFWCSGFWHHWDGGRPLGQRLEIWVWKKSLKYPFLPLFIILLLWVILNFWYKFPWLSMGNISKRKPFFFDSSHFILSQTLMYIGFLSFSIWMHKLSRFLLYRDNSTAMNSHFKWY